MLKQFHSCQTLHLDILSMNNFYSKLIFEYKWGFFLSAFCTFATLTSFHFFCAMCEGPGYIPRGWKPVSCFLAYIHKIVLFYFFFFKMIEEM